MASKTKKKGKIQEVVESAVDAAEELGEAATAFKESWGHVQRARSKARPATRAVAGATRRVAKTATRAVRKARGTAKKSAKAVRKKRR